MTDRLGAVDAGIEGCYKLRRWGRDEGRRWGVASVPLAKVPVSAAASRPPPYGEVLPAATRAPKVPGRGPARPPLDFLVSTRRQMVGQPDLASSLLSSSSSSSTPPQSR